MFEAPKLTSAGKALYYRNLGGEALKITTIQLGDGQLSTPIASLTSLIHTVISIDASVKQRSDYVEVNATFSNAELSSGFYWREVGVFCADPSNPNDRSKDILYCYQNAYDTADYIAPAATELVEKSINIPIIVGDTEKVTCSLDKSLIFVTQKELQQEIHNYSSQSRYITITIPKNAWISSRDNNEFIYVADIEIPDLTPAFWPSVTIDNSRNIAKNAVLFYMAETLNGILRLRAKNAPAEDMTAYVELIAPSTYDEFTVNDYRVASNDDVQQMLDSIYKN